MAQEYESLAARLGGATGQAVGETIGGIGQTLSGLISNRINRLEQEDLQKQKRADIARGIRPMLSPEQQAQAQELAYAPENLIRDYLKNAQNQSQVQDLQRMFSSEAAVPRMGDEMGVPASIMSGIQTPEMYEALPNVQQAQKVLAETLKKQSPEGDQLQLEPQGNAQVQPVGMGLPQISNASPEQKRALSSLGLGQEKGRQQFVQNMQDAPINPNLSPEEKRKAAAYWAALNQIAEKKEQVLQNPEAIPSYIAAESATTGNPSGIAAAYTKPNSNLTPEQYLAAQRISRDLYKEGRQWNQKYINDGIKTGNEGDKIQRATLAAKSLLKTNPPVGVWQNFLRRAGIPLSAGDTNVEILDKIENDIYVKAAQNMKGRITNQLLSAINATKANIFNSRPATEFILDSYDYWAARDKAEGDIIREEKLKWGNQPLPQFWSDMVEAKVKARHNQIDDVYEKLFQQRHNLKFEKSPYNLSDEQLQSGYLKQTDIKDGTPFEKNGKMYIKLKGQIVPLQGGR